MFLVKRSTEHHVPRTFKKKATRLALTFFLHYHTATPHILSYLTFHDTFKLTTCCKKMMHLFTVNPPPQKIFASKEQAEKYLRHHDYFQYSYCSIIIEHLNVLKYYRHQQEKFVWDCRKLSPSLDKSMRKFDTYRLHMATTANDTPFALMSSLKLDKTFRWDDISGKIDNSEQTVVDGIKVSAYWLFWHTDWCKLFLGKRECVLVGQGLVLWLKVAKKFMRTACSRVDKLVELWHIFAKIPKIMVSNEDVLEEMVAMPELDVNFYFKNPSEATVRHIKSNGPIVNRTLSPYRTGHVIRKSKPVATPINTLKIL
jgi:hypothetical protein